MDASEAAERATAAQPPVITYSLRAGRPGSDEYYRAVQRFADDWTAKTLHTVGDVLAGFRAYRREQGRPDRSDPECAFEFLALGVLLGEHGSEAVHWPLWLLRTQPVLIAAQERWPWFASVAKALRGLSLRLVRRPARARLNADVARLLDWLRATGQDSKAGRLVEWQAYLGEIGTYPARRILARCLALASSFAVDSVLALGAYTEQVNDFLARTAPGYHGRYDAEFVSRPRVEYHLGLLGTEILNRAYRARFLAAPHKIVIVPPCLRARAEAECQAVATEFGAKCQACTPACRVHQITRLGEKHGFDVYIIPDELRALGEGRPGSLGVVGVSCALTNWSGGWEAEALGVPAQGVLLDYVGCSYHWDPRGLPTDTNLRRLREVVGLAGER